MANRGRDRAGSGRNADLTVKVQILAAVFLPITLILVWLGSHGFFQAPG